MIENNKNGILTLLDDESKLSKLASVENFTNNVHTKWKSSAVLVKKNASVFTIKHFVNDVSYDTVSILHVTETGHFANHR